MINDYFLDSYSINAWQGLALPICSPYARKHLEKAEASPSFSSKVFHTSLGLIEAFPLAGALVSIIEVVTHFIAQFFISNESLSTTIPSTLQPRQVIPILLIDKGEFGNSQELVEFFTKEFPQAKVINDKGVGHTADSLKKYHSVDNLKSIHEEHDGYCAFFQVLHLISRLDDGALSDDAYESLEKELGFKIHILAYKTEHVPHVFSSKSKLSIAQVSYATSYNGVTLKYPQDFKIAINQILKTVKA